MNPPTSFSSLPPELVTKICRNPVLRNKDLIALRLTSKSQGIHLSASEEFAERHFTVISLAYTRHSLQTFAEICKHSTFGSAVRKVQLSCVRFIPESLGEESKELFDYLWSSPMPQKRREYLDKIRLLVNRCDEEEDLETTGDAGHLLATAFVALSRWQHPLELSVSTWEFNSTLGLSQIYDLDVLDNNQHWDCDILSTVALLLRAAISSKCVVKKLQIQGNIWDNLVDSSADSLTALAQLPELELDFWSTGERDDPGVTGLDDMVTKLLENAVNLRVLHLDTFCADRYQNCLDRIFSILPTMGLEKLKLTNVEIDMFKGFEKRIESLRHLEMDQCEVWDASLKNVLLSVQKHLPRLEYFLVHGISRPWIDPKVELEGVQEISDGIDKLIQSRQNWLDDPPEGVIAWDSDED